MRKHLFIPDNQVKSGDPVDHLRWIGNYIVEKKPDVIVSAGDFADMPSLSMYDMKKRKAEGKRYEDDIAASHAGMQELTGPLVRYNAKRAKHKKKLYKPEKHLTRGNHEFRIERATNDAPHLHGKLSYADLDYESYGWTVHDYLKVVNIDGVHYTHFFCNTQSSRPIGGSIENRLNKTPFSFVQGHQQIYIVGVRDLNNGTRIRGLVCGSCYLHDEEYRGPQSNGEWRGIFLLHEVHNGDYNLLEVSLDFLCRRYEGVGVAEFLRVNYPEHYTGSNWMLRGEG